MTTKTSAQQRLLVDRGHPDAAMLLTSVNDYDFTFTPDGELRARLKVDISVLDRANIEIRKQIADALAQVLNTSLREEYGRQVINSVVLEPSPMSDEDWRTRVQVQAGNRPSNQAGLASLPVRFPTEDRMRFRDVAELRVYQSLKRAQSKLPPGETIAIAPGASVRILAHTWEPDFLVFYKGRAGIIEVDGLIHVRKWSSDRSRDRLFEDAGVSYVDHIDAADTEGAEVDQFVERFLRRLGG